MKFTLIIDQMKGEEVIVYAKERTPLVDEIEKLLKSEVGELLGYKNGEIVIVHPSDVYCFTIEGGKLYAVMENEKYN